MEADDIKKYSSMASILMTTPIPSKFKRQSAEKLTAVTSAQLTSAPQQPVTKSLSEPNSMNPATAVRVEADQDRFADQARPSLSGTDSTNNRLCIYSDSEQSSDSRHTAPEISTDSLIVSSSSPASAEIPVALVYTRQKAM